MKNEFLLVVILNKFRSALKIDKKRVNYSIL